MVALRLRDTPGSVGTTSSKLLNFWLSLHIISGHILLPILAAVFIFLCKRHATLINLCLVWIFTSICSCLLLYAGRHTGQEPPYELCLVQASLLYGTTPLTAMACLALVYQVWASVFRPIQEKENMDPTSPWHAFRPKLLLASPWIIFGIWSTAAASAGFHHPERISRDRRFFYCSLDFNPISTTISVFCALVLLVTMGFEVSIGVSLVRNWRAVRSGINSGQVDLSMLFRVFCFGFYVFIGLILSFVSIKAPKSPVPDLWLASVGLSVALIFGTQRDVLYALQFWNKTPRWQEKRVDLTT